MSVVPTSPHFTFKTLRNITFNAKFLQGKVQGSHVQVAAKSIWKVHNFRDYFSLKKIKEQNFNHFNTHCKGNL